MTETLGKVHFLGSITIVVPAPGFSGGRVTEHGQEIDLTAELLDLNSDRNGRCLFDLVGDEDAQVRRFGKVMMRPGPWPQSELRVEYGTQRWREQYDREHTLAWEITDPQTRAERLELLQKTYGGPPPTSRTLRSYRPA